ncbi:MAG: redoxin domain-containing protein [Candidatus Cloacimonetes bacterium]|nr:redoxin domain-containing protein [Candidatus Cloacimonadota bacterium]MBS3768131.1 redoxin domain-containing protein [Candidatus Cloacimonadota bacterium]
MYKKLLMLIIAFSLSLYSLGFCQDSLSFSEVNELNGENYEEFIKNDIKIVEFYSESCDSLQKLEPKLEQITKDNESIAYGKVDVQANRDFVASLKYKILPDKPTVVFFVDGELANGFVGYPSKEKLSDIVKSVLKKKKMADALSSGKISFMEAYDFTLTSLGGKDITLSELDGMIVLDFWATWCPPCKKEIPYLQEFHENYKDKGLYVIGVSSESAVTQRKFKNDKNDVGNLITYPLLVDSNSVVAKQFGIRSIPTTYFISKEGELITKETGFTEEFVDDYRQIIEANLPE